MVGFVVLGMTSVFAADKITADDFTVVESSYKVDEKFKDMRDWPTDSDGNQIAYYYKLTETTVKKYAKYAGYDIFFRVSANDTSNMFYTQCKDEIAEMLAQKKFSIRNFGDYFFIELKSYPEK